MVVLSKVRVVVEVELVGFDLLLGLDYSVERSVLISQMTASSDCGRIGLKNCLYDKVKYV